MSFPYASYSTYVPPVTYVLPPPPVQVLPSPYIPMYRIQPMPVIRARPVPTCNPFVPDKKAPTLHDIREALKNLMAPRFVKEVGTTVNGLSKSSLASLKVDQTSIFLKDAKLISDSRKFFSIIHNHLICTLDISDLDEKYKEAKVNSKVFLAAFFTCSHMNNAFPYTANADMNLAVDKVRASATQFVETFEKVCEGILLRCALDDDVAKGFLESLTTYYYDFNVWRAKDEERLVPEIKKALAQVYREEYLCVKSGISLTHSVYADILQIISRAESKLVQFKSADYLKEFKDTIYHFLKTGEVNETEAQCIQTIKDTKDYEFPKTSTLGLAVLFGHSDLGNPASFYARTNMIHIMKSNDAENPETHESIANHVALHLKKWRAVRTANPVLGLEPANIDAFLTIAKGRQFTVICFNPSEKDDGINMCGVFQDVQGNEIVRCYESA